MGGILYLGTAVAPRQMRMDLFRTLGSFLIPKGDTTAVYIVGAAAHAVMSLVIGLIYAVFFLPFADGSNVVGWGVLFGFVHWVIMGANLEMMGYIHPLMRTRELRRPGAFAVNFPKATVVAFLFLHLIFGLLVGGLYTAFN